MNWESAQKVLFPRVRNCLQKIQLGTVRPKENVLGTILYLETAWKDIEIFYSLDASLLMQGFGSSHPITFGRLGSDVVEGYFSAN